MARKVTYDQERVKELRAMLIEDSIHVFSGGDTDKWSDYRKELLMKYAPRVLPTLIAGKDDSKDLFPKPMLSPLDVSDNDGDQEDS